MQEFFATLISPAHLPYTLLLGLIILYWLTVILGALDTDFLDFDLETEVEAEMEVEVEADVDADTDSGGALSGWLGHTLSFFNLGQVPFMIFLSVLVLCLWASSIIAHTLIGGEGVRFFVLSLVPNLLLGLLLTKLFTSPFKHSFQQMNQSGTAKKALVGKIGEIILPVASGKIGRLELDTDFGHFLLDVKASDEFSSLAKGTQAILVEYDPHEDLYLVQPFEL